MKKSTKRALGVLGLLAIAAGRHNGLEGWLHPADPGRVRGERSVFQVLDRGQVGQNVVYVRVGEGHQRAF